MAEPGAKQFDVAALDAMVERLGPLANSNVSTMFATTYPQWKEGSIRVPEQRRADALKAILARRVQGAFRLRA